MDQHERHRYRARCQWEGSTAAGYEAYGREHHGECPPASVSVQLSADPAFRGSPERPNPEQLLLRPRIVVAGDVPLERLHRLVELAHQACYIANSLRCEVDIQPTFVRIRV
ncbi:MULTISPECIES: OsmC family protein [unclassified Frankia]|uniref:OsmC family protein n=1 Tax=unclassified Frankia TaxID=2632575 RepID=UPI002024E96A